MKGPWGSEGVIRGYGVRRMGRAHRICSLHASHALWGFRLFYFCAMRFIRSNHLKLHETRLKGIKVTPGKALPSLPSLLDLSGVLARAEGPVLPLRTGLFQGFWEY